MINQQISIAKSNKTRELNSKRLISNKGYRNDGVNELFLNENYLKSKFYNLLQKLLSNNVIEFSSDIMYAQKIIDDEILALLTISGNGITQVLKQDNLGVSLSSNFSTNRSISHLVDDVYESIWESQAINQFNASSDQKNEISCDLLIDQWWV
ncbi:MAG: hypothetical protein Q8T03_11075 [Bacteroidota bacterium]|nr:hypothetical protein [Bacteroidota bacterium]